MSEETTLADLRVLDLSSSVAGAFCARLFADYGADVIAISPPGAPPPLGEGKRSVTLDITKPAAREVFEAMVEKANVVIETLAEGTLESLGLAFPQLEAIKRRIIVVSVPDGADEAASLFAGLNAFAAAALAVFNADSHEIPQHIRISPDGCLAAVRGFPAGGLPADEPLFTSSTVGWERGETPAAGEHSAEVFGEIGLPGDEVARLRDEGAV
jgi:crotonobetainyl-CoA:carnitine CoA-transferase CaiB-like acyl-CoA transferase